MINITNKFVVGLFFLLIIIYIFTNIGSSREGFTPEELAIQSINNAQSNLLGDQTAISTAQTAITTAKADINSARASLTTAQSKLMGDQTALTAAQNDAPYPFPYAFPNYFGQEANYCTNENNCSTPGCVLTGTTCAPASCSQLISQSGYPNTPAAKPQKRALCTLYGCTWTPGSPPTCSSSPKTSAKWPSNVPYPNPYPYAPGASYP